MFNAVTPQFGGNGMFSSEPAAKAGQFLKGAAGGAVLGGVAGAATGMKGAALLGNTSNAGGLKRVASATATSSKATAVGAGKGAIAGARRAGAGTNNAALMAGSAGKHAADRVIARALNGSRYAQPETPQESAVDDSPVSYAREQREAVRAQERYTQDWEKHHNDAAWNSRFQSTYGFEAPNPSTHAFPGYGKPRTALSADLMPRPIRPETSAENAPVSMPVSNVNTAPKAAAAAAPSHLRIPVRSDAPVMPQRPVRKPSSRGGAGAGGGAPRPRP